jgi:restriction system protein
VKDVREFQAAMKNFGADFGLFVSWGGFRRSVEKEVLRHFFDVRLWDADDLVDEILDQYPKLPEATQTELPLKQIWVLVGEEET